MTNQSQALAEALRAIAEGNLGDMPWQANYERIRKVAADALAQYEKPDTDRDQLLKALDLAEQISGRNGDEHVSLTPRGWEYIYAAFDACRAALASKTAIDPVTVEADTACNHIIAARTFLVISEPDHADRHLKAALRSLGSQS